MIIFSDVVTYRWTEVDVLAVTTKFPGVFVTPYRIPPDALEYASDFASGDYVDLPLGASIDIPTIARFYRDGYEWIPLPPEVDPGEKLLDLFNALYAYDPVRFAHCDIRLAMLDKAVNTVEDIAAGKFPTGIASIPSDIASITPLADLAQLHFDYWGNTDLRFAVFAGTVGTKTLSPFDIVSFTIPWFGSDFTSLPLALIEPAMIPTQKDGASIQFVLARRPPRGVTIAAPPTTKPGGKPVVVMSLPPPRIELDGWDRQVLEPLSLDGMKTRAGSVRFIITLPRPSVSTTIEILRNGIPYHMETHVGGEYLIPGPHQWCWDGYDLHGVYDTVALKTGLMAARVTVVDPEGRVATSITSLGTGPDNIRWVDAKLDTKAKYAEVTVYANIINPSDIELASITFDIPSILGGLLPGIPGLPALPGASPPIPGMPGLDSLKLALNVPPILDLDPEMFAIFKQNYVIDSIARCWSFNDKTETKSVTTGMGDKDKYKVRIPARSFMLDHAEWHMATSCQERSTDGITMILSNAPSEAFDDKGMEGLDRSTNLATFMEGLPIIDQYKDPTFPGADVGAHELGHSVLRETKGVWYSLTHKGSSTPGQDKIKKSEGGMDDAQKAADIVAQVALGGAGHSETYSPTIENPKEGEHGGDLDVMLYYFGHDNTAVVIERMAAESEDACGLLWMGKVAWG